MKKGKKVDQGNGLTQLPEAMIHHIQSFLSGKEAARTTILSKSWYKAWLTRPSIDLDENYFCYHLRESFGRFDEFATKTMQRYQNSSMKIESFRLHMQGRYRTDLAHKLVVNAMKIGATDLELVLLSFTLPQEVLRSETLVRLSLSSCSADWNPNHLSCLSLKSLSLSYVRMKSEDEFKDIISCCNSLEELSLSQCYDLAISRENLFTLHKLRRLFLHWVVVDSMFLTDFGSRFPCLKDLGIHKCNGFTRIHIASTSLQTISFEPAMGSSWKAKFDVPNIRKFTYSGFSLPHFSVNEALREWEFNISIAPNTFHKPSWFLNLKRLLTKFRLSRISLSIHLHLSTRHRRFESEHKVDIQVIPKPLVVDSLMIRVPSSYCCAILVRLFGICRPKFITHYWLSGKCYGDVCGKNEFLDILCKRLMPQLITPKCGIPDQSMFGQFGLKKVNVKVYEMFGIKWRPIVLKKPIDPLKAPVSKRKVRFELIWED